MLLTCAECFQLGASSEAADTELRELYGAVHVDRGARSIFPLVLDVFDRVRVCCAIADILLVHTADYTVSNLGICDKKLVCCRDRAMLRVIEYFAKSLKVSQDH